ncbi:MAG TPA: hypothetical protein VKG79_00020, partial [Bryobacteraceae bacterium]|nr:hypothetical protein [Bryobacteraceae bacterium]
MNDLLWPAARLNEALHALVAHALVRAATPLMASPSADVIRDAESLNDWLTTAARTLNVEAQPTETTYAAFEQDLPAMSPALIQVPSGDSAAFLALIPGKRPQVLAPDLKTHRVSPAAIRTLLCGTREATTGSEIQQLLD